MPSLLSPSSAFGGGRSAWKKRPMRLKIFTKSDQFVGGCQSGGRRVGGVVRSGAGPGSRCLGGGLGRCHWPFTQTNSWPEASRRVSPGRGHGLYISA